jgi:hypothetical protein
MKVITNNNNIIIIINNAEANILLQRSQLTLIYITTPRPSITLVGLWNF